MKKIIYILLISSIFTSCNFKNEIVETNQIITDSTNTTNDYFDNAEVYNLTSSNQIMIDGEIENAGTINFSDLPIQNVIVKETLIDKENGEEFIGAYRYYGYSLWDILNKAKISKKNKNEFKPIVDLYVEIENDKGEKINISWGEIYLPNHLKEIIIATKVMRIIPTKSKDLWELPTENKMIIPSDLLTERNISNPVKITIKSFNKSFKTIKGLKPLYSPKIDIYKNEILVATLTKNPRDLNDESLHTILYGKGHGMHSTKPFTGKYLKEFLIKHLDLNKKNIREGLLTVVAKDGYRVVYTLSEIINRNDQSEVLLVCNPELKDNGIFRLVPTSDFFSDRAIKGIDRIYITNK